MAESFDIDEKSHRRIVVGQDTLDKLGYGSAKELVKDALKHMEDDKNDSEQYGKRRFGRGYQGGDR
jgi:hypothetical protein